MKVMSDFFTHGRQKKGGFFSFKAQSRFRANGMKFAYCFLLRDRCASDKYHE
jgi:hypothetical protein